MKHIEESLNKFEDNTFFNSLLEGAEDNEKVSDKNSKNQDRIKKEGMGIIRKMIQNFKLFKTQAAGDIKTYKEFWEKQKHAYDLIKQKGIFYSLYDSKYIIGVVKNAKGNAELKLYDTNYDYSDKENFELFICKVKSVILEFMKVQKELESAMKAAISDHKQKIASKKEEIKNKNIEARKAAKKAKLDKFVQS